jgi:hypothetical protein
VPIIDGSASSSNRTAPQLQRSARSVLDKVNAVVPEKERRQLQATALFSLSFGKGRQAAKNLGELRAAVNQRRRIASLPRILPWLSERFRLWRACWTGPVLNELNVSVRR